jgi:hypothetical protein
MGKGMAITIRALVAILGLATVGVASAGQWKQVAKGASGELWVDTASVKRNNGEVAFEYRIDTAKPLQVVDAKDMYRSLVTKAKVRCVQRTISIGPSMAYAGPKATGKLVGQFPPSPEEARFQPVEPNTSDESLWIHVCKIAQLTPQK